MKIRDTINELITVRDPVQRTMWNFRGMTNGVRVD